jgi:putative heme iron utilization protein
MADDHAVAARLLLRRMSSGALGTLSAAGAPYVSLVAVLDDGAGRPLFLLSSLAEHTRNLKADARASLLVSAESTKATMDRPRITFLGKVVWLAGEEADAARARFTDALPEAAVWVTLTDFQPARLEPDEVRYVGGFARAATLSVEDYLAAKV